MHLVKRITSALLQTPLMTEAQIKKQIKQPKIDYGTCNNTLRRLCRHGVLRRSVGVSTTSGIPSWHYMLIMGEQHIDEYIEMQEAKMLKHKTKNESYVFGGSHTIDTAFDGGPIMIGYGVAPVGMEGRCLAVSSKYELITQEHDGITILSFRPKKH
jgi:hypothetical protein